MFIVIIVGTLLGGGAQAAITSLLSNAADSHEQGQTMGAISALNSLMAVLAPVVSAALLGLVSHRPPGDVWIGLPFFFCALLIFGPHKIRQQILVAPTLCALRCPAVKVGLVTPYINHAVDGRRPSQSLATRQTDTAIGGIGLRLCFVPP